jgi:hypothetical protein
MAVEKRLSRDKFGQPVLTVRVVGAHDIYRLSRHLLYGQVEFGELGQRALRSLRRQMGRARYALMEDYFAGRAFPPATPAPATQEASDG